MANFPLVANEQVSNFNDINAWIRALNRLTAIKVDVHQYGAVGEGADDTAAIDLAMDAAYALATTVNKKIILEFNGDKTYVIARRVVGSSTLGAIFSRRGVCLEGNGATLQLSTADTTTCSFITAKWPIHSDKNGTATTETAITANVAKNDTQITVTSTTGFSVGDDVFLRINDNAYDVAETKDPMFAKVLTVDSATLLTLDRPVPVAMTVASTATANKKIIKLHEPIEEVFIRNFHLINSQAGTANAEYGIDLRYTRNCVVENITAEHPGTGIVVGGYNEDLTLRNLRLRTCDKQGAHVAKGRALNLWNTRNLRIEQLYAEDFEGNAVRLESYCRGTVFDGLHTVNNHASRSNSSVGLLFIGGGSDAEIRSWLVEGTGGTPLVDGSSQAHSVTYGDLNLNTSSQTKGSFKLKAVNGLFRNGATVYDEVWTWSKRIWLRPSLSLTNQSFTMPSGIYRAMRIYASTVTGITDLRLYSGVTSGANLFASLSAGAVVAFNSSEQFGTDYPYNNTLDHTIRIATDGTLPADAYLIVRASYFPSATDDLGQSYLQDDTPMANAYTPTNITPDRSFDADTVLVAELADVVGTLVADLQARGVLR